MAIQFLNKFPPNTKGADVAAHRKYRVVDYTKRWTADECFSLLEISRHLKRLRVRKSAWWSILGQTFNRSADACQHKYRTLCEGADRLQVGGGPHKWADKEVRKVLTLTEHGHCAAAVATKFPGVTKYAIWHMTKRTAPRNKPQRGNKRWAKKSR